jgi:cell division protease FtsH
MVVGSDPIHKVSIIPRGRALGVTMQLPIEDKHSYNRESLLGRIAVLMGGRAAEELIFNTFTTGAGNDIERATDMARKMVCEWGMSDLMGPVSLGKKDESIFLGRDMAMHKNFSEETAIKIDEEIKRIVDESYQRAITILRENLESLHNLSVCLIEKENLTGSEVDDIIAGHGPVCTGKKPEQPQQPEDVTEEQQKPVDIQA